MAVMNFVPGFEFTITRRFRLNVIRKVLLPIAGKYIISIRQKYMNSTALLHRNHDIHLHSRDFSDGKHPLRDVIRFTARWQEPPRCVGLSDHNPGTEYQLASYIQKVRELRHELRASDGIDLLVGMELEWAPTGPALSGTGLADLDYILAGYHGMAFSTAEQAEGYFLSAANFQYTDIVAHPDRFLGKVDPLTIDWASVFSSFASQKVACEYNLTTPLRAEVFSIALNQTEVQFVIGTDTHDFRSIGVRRIVDAWSESLGGGYDQAYDYLMNLMKLVFSPTKSTTLVRLFETSQALDEFQRKLFLRSLGKKGDYPLEEDEEKFVTALNKIPEGDIDRAFLSQRLERFNGTAAERILSTLSCEDFRRAVKHGRQWRGNQVVDWTG